MASSREKALLLVDEMVCALDKKKVADKITENKKCFIDILE